MQQNKLSRTQQLWRDIKWLMVIWSLVIGASLAWSLLYQQHSFKSTLHTQASAFHTMEMEYRNWIIHSGGIYAPVTEQTQPSPWLSGIPERDITTPSGKQLTLLNSSYVVRKVHEGMVDADSPLRGHIASLNPVNPSNTADSWERQALQAFATGQQEWTAVEVMDDNKTYFRFMKPMVTEADCLKCHAQYGARLGDIRGGVSVSVPIDALLLDQQHEQQALFAGHGLLWGLGLFGLFMGGRRQQQAIAIAEQSEAQVTLLTNSIAHAIYGQDKEGCCTFINAAGVKAFGFDHASELLGQHMHTLVHHTREDGSPYPAEDCPSYFSIHDGKSSYREDEILWRKDGTSFPAIFWSYPVLQEGRVQGAVVTFLDVTEQMRVKGELHHSQVLLNSIVENIPAMVFLKRAEDLRFELFNLAGEQLVGYSRNDLLGKNDTDLFPKAQADAFMQKDREVLENRRLLEIPEEPIKIADGSEKWLHTFKVGLYDESNRPTHLLGISVDITANKRMRDELREQQRVLTAALEGTIHTVSMAVEVRDPYTGGHQRRVADLACAIAQAMGLDEERIHGVRLGALIHDIGKIGIPVEILSKPSKLTPLEMDIVREHAVTGYNILKEVQFPWPVADIAHQHHERIDGSGYPQGLKGDEICLEARIVAVADVVESIASHRPYRPALGMPAAMEEIVRNRGVLYDEQVLDACLQVLHAGFQFE